MRLRPVAQIGLFLGLVVLASVPASPHQHTGADGEVVSWYPKECCREGDCRPVALIKRAPNGLWMTTEDGYTILVGPNDVRRSSRDARWHVCIGTEQDDPTPRLRCVFEPSNS
jgi:hypothetical protein